MVAVFARPRLTDQVVTYMSDLITDGTWAAGMMLPTEAELVQQLGVSRTVIRECVRVLSSRGMLDVRQGRGTVVTSAAAWTVVEPLALLVKADRSELLNWLEVRAILEVESAALAARRRLPPDVSALQGALERVQAPADDPTAYMEADIHLHLTIARAARNPALLRLLQPVVQPLREHLQETALVPEARDQALREHGAIIAAILEGDAEQARAAMTTHLHRVAEEIAQLLRQTPSTPPASAEPTHPQPVGRAPASATALSSRSIIRRSR